MRIITKANSSQNLIVDHPDHHQLPLHCDKARLHRTCHVLLHLLHCPAFGRLEWVYANWENSHSSAYIPSTIVFTTPVATIASSSPVPYTSTIPVPYTSEEVVYTSSVPVVSTRTSVISIEVSTSIVQVPTSAVEVPTTAVEVPTSRGPVATIPVYLNSTSTYVAPPAGTATGGAPGGAPAATTTNKAFLGAANKAYTASGASLVALLGLAAILL